MQQLKLIWDFRGPDSIKIAEHHLVHLKEYIKQNNLDISITGTETISRVHSTAYLVIAKEDMPPVRDALKPHRGQIYAPKKGD